MKELLYTLCNQAILGGIAVLAVCLVRLLLTRLPKKAPRYIVCLLWLVVAVRLLCPFSVQTPLGLLTTNRPLSEETLQLTPSDRPTDMAGDTTVDTDTTLPITPPADNPTDIMGDDNQSNINTTPPVDVPEEKRVNTHVLPFALWAVGAAGLLLYGMVGHLRLCRRVGEAVPEETTWGRVYRCTTIGTPFVLGLLRPRVYVPAALPTADLPYVVAHEQAHIRRGDPWYKVFAYLLLAVYWFQPLCWLAFRLLCRDLEVACDERVMKTFGDGAEEQKKAYSSALLGCAAREQGLAFCPVAFGGTDVGGRIKNILHYKKPVLWLTVTAAAVCAAVGVALLTTRPARKTDTPLSSDGLPVQGQVTTTTTTQEQTTTTASTDTTGTAETTGTAGSTPSTTGKVPTTKKTTTKKTTATTAPAKLSAQRELQIRKDFQTFWLSTHDEDWKKVLTMDVITVKNYFGKFGDGEIVQIFMDVQPDYDILAYQVAGYHFPAARSAQWHLYLYKDGTFTRFKDAYEAGRLTRQETYTIINMAFGPYGVVEHDALRQATIDYLKKQYPNGDEMYGDVPKMTMENIEKITPMYETYCNGKNYSGYDLGVPENGHIAFYVSFKNLTSNKWDGNRGWSETRIEGIACRGYTYTVVRDQWLTLFVYKDGKVRNVADAYAEGWLEDKYVTYLLGCCDAILSAPVEVAPLTVAKQQEICEEWLKVMIANNPHHNNYQKLTVEDLKFTYYNTYGGAVAYQILVKGWVYTAEVWDVDVAGHTITMSHTRGVGFYKDGEFKSIKDAYVSGWIDKETVLDIKWKLNGR